MDIQSQVRQEIRDMIKEGLEIKVLCPTWDNQYIKLQLVWEEEVISEAWIDSVDIGNMIR